MEIKPKVSYYDVVLNCKDLISTSAIAKDYGKSAIWMNRYRAFCNQVGEYVRSSADFYSAIESFGFERFRNAKGRYIKEIKLKSEFEQD